MQVDPHSGLGVGVAVGDKVGDGVVVGVGLAVGVGVVNALQVPSAVCSSQTPHFDTVTTLHTYVWLIVGVKVTLFAVVVPVLMVLLPSVLSIMV